MENEGFKNFQYREILDNCQLLKELDKERSQSFLSLFKEEKWPKNTCILSSDKLEYRFYIILSGRVKMYQINPSGKELTLFLLTKSDVFDIFCLLDGMEHDAFYECLDDVKVLAAPMDKLRQWFQKHPEFYRNLLPYAGKQLRLLETSVSSMTFTDISTRLLLLLVKNVNNTSKNLELINDLPNKEIANLIGSTRAVVNRHLQKLKKNGSIKLSRNKMEIQDLALLLRELENQKNQQI